MKGLYAIALLLLSVASATRAQNLQSRVNRKILILSDSTLLDSLPIVSGTFIIDSVWNGRFAIDHPSALLMWRGDYPTDSISISYRTLQIPFNKSYFHKEVSLLERFFTENPFSYVPPAEQFNSLGDNQLLTSGNLSRGIGIGNNQDLVVNSNLNLHLRGQIADGVNVLAAVSDENNPIQPEGNTQQLQDFDRVYISLWKDSNSLTAGDFPMNSDPRWYFMRYQKRSRGAQLGTTQTWRTTTLRANGEVALSRGRFTRNLIEGIEGNQGPYRLRGANGEIFIIIIAGTEKVYKDGKLLERGQQNDYTIDYNSGEVTFMPTQLITRYSRIVVEFQYSDRNYARSVLRGGAELEGRRWTLYSHAFSEQDHRNRPFQQDLDLFDSVNMLSARDVLSIASGEENPVIGSARPLNSFDPNRILYIKKDSNGYKDIFVYTPIAGEYSSFFQVQFSFVGEGKGNYLPLSSNANGKVYAWVEPVGEIKQGSYEPVQILIAPERRQMLSVGAQLRIDSQSQFRFEWSGSHLDQNTFNRGPESAELGQGLMLNFKSNRVKELDSIRKNLLQTDIKYEYASRSFRSIERYRDVEFDRIWNRTLTNQENDMGSGGDEHILNTSLNWRHASGFYLNAGESFYRRGSGMDAWHQDLKGGLLKSSGVISAQMENLRSSAPIGNEMYSNTFDRAGIQVARRLGSTKAQIEMSNERSLFDQDDSLSALSYRYQLYRASLHKADSNSFHYSFQLSQRNDQLASSGRLRPNTTGRDATLQATWDPGRNLGMKLSSTYRQLSFADSLDTEETVQGRLEFRLEAFRRVVQAQTYYQLGTGQEQRREFSYLQVGDGNGLYLWNDFDSNGVQSLDEFVPASDYDRQRANYIRQFVPVAGLVKSYSSEFNSNVRIQAPQYNRKSAGLSWIRRFSLLSSTRVQKKVGVNTAREFYNPFYLKLDDSALISSSTTLRHTLSFNRASPVFGCDVQHVSNLIKSLLVNGFDQRENDEWTLRIRWNVQRRWEIIQEQSHGTRGHLSGYLGERSYRYKYSKWSPELQYYFNRNLRLTGRYVYFEAQNDPLLGSGRTYNHELRSGLRLNVLNRGSLTTDFGWVDVNFRGNESSALGYALLEGLRNGRNFTWNLQMDRRFRNNIQLLITYDGRRSEGNNALHMGRFQARYIF